MPLNERIWLEGNERGEGRHMSKVAVKHARGWEDGIIAELPCRNCGVGRYRTSDVLTACLTCDRCRECNRSRKDPCHDCRMWDLENRGEDGKMILHGVRKRRAHGE